LKYESKLLTVDKPKPDSNQGALESDSGKLTGIVGPISTVVPVNQRTCIYVNKVDLAEMICNK